MKKSIAISVIAVLLVLSLTLCTLYLTNNANKQKEIDALTSDIAGKVDQIETLNADVADKAGTIETLSAEVAEKTDTIETLNADLADKSAQIDKLNSDVADKASTIETLNEDAADKSVQIEKLTTDVADKTSIIETLNADVANKAAQIEELNTDIADKTSTIETLNADVADKTTRIKELNKDVAKKDGEIETLNADVEDKAAKIETLNTDVADKDNVIETLNADVKEKSRQIEKLNTDTAKKDSMIETLKTDVADKADQIEVLKKEVTNKNDQIEALRADSTDKSHQIEQLTSENEKKDEQIEDLKADIESKDNQINNLNLVVQTKDHMIAILEEANAERNKITPTPEPVDTPTQNLIDMSTPEPTEEPVMPIGEMINRYAVTIVGELKFRETPGTGKANKVLDTIKKSKTYVWVIRTEENDKGELWSLVEYNGRTGYIMSRYLSLLTQEDSDAYNSAQISPAPVYTLEDLIPPEELARAPEESQQANQQHVELDGFTLNLDAGAEYQMGTKAGDEVYVTVYPYIKSGDASTNFNCVWNNGPTIVTAATVRSQVPLLKAQMEEGFKSYGFTLEALDYSDPVDGTLGGEACVILDSEMTITGSGISMTLFQRQFYVGSKGFIFTSSVSSEDMLDPVTELMNSAIVWD